MKFASIALFTTVFSWFQPISAAPTFSDSFEGSLTSWQTTGQWNLSTERHQSGNHGVCDSPGAFYQNHTDSALTLTREFNLSTIERPVMVFQHAYELEEGYDFANVEYSLNGGQSWQILKSYTGNQASMQREQLDLSSLASATRFSLRFHMTSDDTVVMDGWFLDDVILTSAPAPVTLATPSASEVTQTKVNLSWSLPPANQAASFAILRSAEPITDWRKASVIATLTNPSATSFTDISVAPKSTYYYQILTLDADGAHSLSAPIQVKTPAGMDFPFFDTCEAGSNFWIASPPWAITTETAHTGTKSWSDSPNGDYQNQLDSLPLTLAAPIDLTKSTNPVLSFCHQYQLADGDTANVEISTNQGASWSSLAIFQNQSVGWLRARIPLNAWANQAAVWLRFRLTTNNAVTADGWHIDEISVAEAPATVPAPAITELASHSLKLSWTKPNSPPISHYAIHRSTTPNVTLNSPCIATVGADVPANFIDTNLASDTTYYYRIYAVSAYQTHSADSTDEASAHTLNHPIPFTDRFESPAIAWNFGGNSTLQPWQVSPSVAHSGSACLASSPNGSYPPNLDAWADLSVDLRNTEWPILAFWDRFGLNSGDWFRIEISAPGGPTHHVYGSFESSRSAWQQQRIDLSPWKNLANVKIRFRFLTDNAPTTGEGWFIDDLELLENPNRNTPLTLPHHESFSADSSHFLLTNWSYQSPTDDPSHPVLQFGGPYQRIAPDTEQCAVLDQPVILPKSSNIQASYLCRGRLDGYSYLRLHYSTNQGLSWNEFPEVNRNTGFNTPSWEHCQANLQPLSSQTEQSVRLRFYLSGNGYAPIAQAQIDHLTLTDMPAASPLLSALPSLRSVNVTWQASSLANSFVRYELWRSTSANVSPSNGEKIFTSTQITDTHFTDTGLTIGGTYFYKVFTIDQNHVAIPSNELSATTVPLTLPVTDPMDSMDNWVTGTNNSQASTWAASTVSPHSGTAALSTSSVGQYPSSADQYIETAVDLRNSEWPILTFWDRFQLNSGDWFRIEISAAGGPSICAYGSMEGARPSWQLHKIDLSPWKNLANVKIRFRFTSDAAPTNADGWAIDDVAILENPHRSTPVTLPFHEDFAGNTDHWLLTGWHLKDSDSALQDGSLMEFGSSSQRIAPDTQQSAVLDRPVLIPTASNLQASYSCRGRLDGYAYLRLHYSLDGGISWGEFPEVNRNAGFNTPTWEHCQASLKPLSSSQPTTARLRIQASGNGYAPVTHLEIDQFTLAEMPPSPALVSAVPALRSVDLSWQEASPTLDFSHYEVWRSTSPNVSFSNGQMLASLASIHDGHFTDSNLNIGGTYYYRIFTVTSRNLYIPSNELGATTVPVTLPFADAMDTLDHWVTGSNNANPSTWAPSSVHTHDGSTCIASTAVGQYASNTDSFLETAVDLRNTEWPILTFDDRIELDSGDWSRVEISAPGGPSLCVYGHTEVNRPTWQHQRIDLSPWKNLSNVKIRFHLVSDGAPTNANGWSIDQLQIIENPHRNSPVTLPFHDDFEKDSDHWLLTSWTPTADDSAYNGAACLGFNARTHRISPDSQQWATLDRPVELPKSSNVQVSYACRGRLDGYSYLRLNYSTDHGINWAELPEVNRNTGFNTNQWELCQADLKPLAAANPTTIRLRFAISGNGYAPVAHAQIDQFSLAEMPAPPTILPIDEINVTSLRLNWQPSPTEAFKAYAIYRSITPSVDRSSTLIATLTQQSTASFTDTNLDSRIRYYYRIYTIDTRDAYGCSEVVSATTAGSPLPANHSFDSPPIGWSFSGNWQVQANTGRNGSAALVDSLGDSTPYTDTFARFAVNLSHTTWPVLSYWDRHAYNGSSWGRVEISTDNANWQAVAGVTESRTTWQFQQIDLSPWKNCPSVFIRFRSATDGTPSDGWYLDDVKVTENPLTPTFPFFENGKNSQASWLASSWTTVTDPSSPSGGALHDTVNTRYSPDCPNTLTLAQEIDLTHATAPSLTYFIKGTLSHYSSFRTHISTDHGLTWAELPSLNHDTGFSSPTWLKQQVSLTPYLGQSVRIRFQSYGNSYQPASDILLTHIGIGEDLPNPPTVASPTTNQTVDVVRPTLTVTNAIDCQSDALTYQFEVYADSSLTRLVAQVPAVASGATHTSWQVDVDLPDHAPYWWRARASDGQNTSPWTTPTVFNINEFDNPPLPVQIVGPADDSTFIDGDGLLMWIQTSDPDLGDSVTHYQIQIDNNPDFSSPEIDHAPILVDHTLEGPGYMASVALSTLPHSRELPAGRWFWRIRARDTKFAYGPWSTGYSYFRLPTFYQRYLRSRYQDPQWFEADVTNPDADPDGNGIGVMMEFACAITPGEPAGDRLPKATEITQLQKKHQGFYCTRRKLSEMKFELVTSTDLIHWTPVPNAQTEIIESLDSESERIRIIDPTPVGTYRKRFLNIRISD